MAISFKGAHFPPDIILMGVRWYVAYPLTLQRHLIHSLATPMLAVVVTDPSWLTSDALRASQALRPPPPRRMAAPSGAPSEARGPDSCGGESCSSPSWQRNGQCLGPSRARSPKT